MKAQAIKQESTNELVQTINSIKDDLCYDVKEKFSSNEGALELLAEAADGEEAVMVDNTLEEEQKKNFGGWNMWS